jgi:hypothetical protein
MSLNTMDFSKLSSAEIARLFNETRKLAIKERYGVAEEQPNNRRAGNSPYHLDPSGAVCDCKGGPQAHVAPEERFYQSQEGAMVRLEPGDERPTSLQDERTERLIRMPQSQVDNLNPQAKAELLEFRDAIIEERAMQFRQQRPKYRKDAENFYALIDYLANEHLGLGLDDPDDADDMAHTLLERGCWTVEHLCSAYDDLCRQGKLLKLPGEVKKLDAEEFRACSAAASNAHTDTDYERVLDHYLYLSTGSAKGARALALDPRYASAVSEGVYFVFAHSTPEYQETPEAKKFLKRYVGNRFVSVRLLRAGLAAYLKAKENGELQEQPVLARITEEDRQLAEAQQIANEIARASWQGL